MRSKNCVETLYVEIENFETSLSSNFLSHVCEMGWESDLTLYLNGHVDRTRIKLFQHTQEAAVHLPEVKQALQ